MVFPIATYGCKTWTIKKAEHQITVNSDCSHEIKTLLGRKAMTDLDSILKSRDINLLIKVHIVKAVFFSNSYVQM